jgi:hypothetical protein
MIFTVAPTVTTDLFKDVSEYRRKDLFDSRSFTIDKITFVRGADTTALEKSKGKDGKDAWKNAAGKEVDAAKVDDLLAKVGSLRADKFQSQVDPAVKSSPTLKVTSRFDNGKEETVSLAKTGETVLASRADEPGGATVETMAFDELVKALDALK